MKTERFDEEFRRKLLGLPAEADPGEVERIQDFVNANKPALPGLGWGKLLLYGGSSLLLLGSLSYNLLQSYRNTHLQSSIDSLAHRLVGQAMPAQLIRHDTVYITRSGHAEGLPSGSVPGVSPETVANEPVEQAHAPQVDIAGHTISDATGETNSSLSGHEASSSQPKAGFPRSLATDASTVHHQRRKKSSQVRHEADRVVSISPITSPDGLLTEKTNPVPKTERINKPAPYGPDSAEEAYSTVNLPAATRSKNHRGNKRSGLQTSPSSTSNGQLVTNRSGNEDQKRISGLPTAGFTSVNTEDAQSNGAVSDLTRPIIQADLLVSRQRIPSNQWAIISPGHPLVIPKNGLPAQAIRQRRHLTMPTLSVPNAQYRIGGELTAGNDQLGGALLGEVMLNRHWSMQAGLRVVYNQGFHYRDEQEFDEHEKEDFRQTYASQVPSSSDIQDIEQRSLLVQVPLQVAYHSPLGRQWGLRLGVGTDLDVWVRSAIRYDYRESSRSSGHGLSLLDEPVHVFNNLTLSTSLERSWKKWLFRAGPFIRPQLRTVGYKPEDLSWGANLQILYRLGK